AVTLRDGRPVLTATIDKAPSGARIYRDARLRLRPQTPLEDMALDVESRGHRSAGELRRDDVLAAERTRTPVFIGDVLNVFSEDARTHLRQLIGELARGLPDGGAQLRSAFAAVTPWLEAQATLTRTLAARRGITRRLVHNLRALLGELGSRDRALVSLVSR